MKSPTPLIIDHIADQIANVNRQIVELTQERLVLEKLLLRARKKDVSLPDVTRKNSLSRILAEKTIIECITKAGGKAISSGTIFDAVRAIDYSVKSVTFRSYLHRLKARGLISPHQSRTGYWMLPLNPS
jgi:DNA-binding response OmpR family regulator